MNYMNRRAYRTSEMVFSLQPSTRVFSSAPNHGPIDNKKLPMKKKEEKEKTPLPFSRENKVKLAKELIVLILSTVRCVYRAASSCPGKARSVMKDFKDRYDNFMEPHACSKINKQIAIKNKLQNLKIIEIINERLKVNKEEPKTGIMVERNNESHDRHLSIHNTFVKTNATEQMKLNSGKTDHLSITDTSQECSRVKEQMTINDRLENLKIIEVVDGKIKVKNEEPKTRTMVDGNKECHDRNSRIQDTLVKINTTEHVNDNYTGNKSDHLSITRTKSGTNKTGFGTHHNLQNTLTQVNTTGLSKQKNNDNHYYKLYKTKSDDCDNEKKQRVMLPKSYFTMIFKRKEDYKIENWAGNTTDSKYQNNIDTQNDIKITIVKPAMIKLKDISDDVKTKQAQLAKINVNNINEVKTGNVVNNLSEKKSPCLRFRNRIPKPHITELNVEPVNGLTLTSHANKDSLHLTEVNKEKNYDKIEKVQEFTANCLQHGNNLDPNYGVHMRPTLTNMYITEINKEKNHAKFENTAVSRTSLHPTLTSSITESKEHVPRAMTNPGNQERNSNQS